MIYHDPYTMADIEPCDFFEKYKTDEWVPGEITPGSSFYGTGAERKSNIQWLTGEIQDELGGLLLQVAENAEYNWKLEELESIQLSSYAEGDFYTWHTDTNVKRDLPNPRKLSFTIWLNDPSEYEGGEFELWDGSPLVDEDKRVKSFKEKKGKLIMFPSYTWHQVKPVTKGTRYSLVGWMRGPEWV